MFRLLRYFSVASLLAFLAALVALVWFYRHVAVEGISHIAERSNVALARTTLTSLSPLLLDYLRATETLHPESIARFPRPPELSDTVGNLLLDRTVVRIKLFNRRGTVIYSNRDTQVGSNQQANAGFKAAIRGNVASNLVYRDSFNHFDGNTEDENLMQTYLPVRDGPNGPVHGVFEIYTDVDHLARQTERTEFMTLFGALVILSAMYAAVVLIVWRAGRLIERQQAIIRERSSTLEALSAHMLRNEEIYKQKIAVDLHEGLAQTLSGIKMHVENIRAHDRKDGPRRRAVDAIIPALQGAIRDVQSIARELRPSSIDDFGLLLTLQLLCRAFERQHPPFGVDLQITLEEADIPAQLKIILYRIVASVLDDMARQPPAGRVTLALWRDGTTLSLMIDDSPPGAHDATAIPLANIDPQQRQGLARMEELATLSGGTFTASHHAGGGATLYAHWSV